MSAIKLKIVANEPALQSPAPCNDALAPLLELKQVCKSYGTGKDKVSVLKNINLDIKAGEFIAIVGFSGRLGSRPPFAPAVATPVLLVHGSADSVIPANETVKAAAALRSLGLSVESHILPGLDHTISTEGIALAGQFLAGRLGS